MKYKYVAISENWKEMYCTKKAMLKDLKNWGNETVYCYSYKKVGERNDKDLTSEDLVMIRRK